MYVDDDLISARTAAKIAGRSIPCIRAWIRTKKIVAKGKDPITHAALYSRAEVLSAKKPTRAYPPQLYAPVDSEAVRRYLWLLARSARPTMAAVAACRVLLEALKEGRSVEVSEEEDSPPLWLKKIG